MPIDLCYFSCQRELFENTRQYCSSICEKYKTIQAQDPIMYQKKQQEKYIENRSTMGNPFTLVPQSKPKLF